MARRSTVLDEIASLDPGRDHQRIARLSAGVDFPWDTRRAYEIALLKTLAVPSSSRLLVATDEFIERTAKRHDDTVAIIATLGLMGYDSPQGREALRIMNRAHRAYVIPAEEYRYTLALFALEPIRFNARFGWRPLLEVERQAGFEFWRAIGERMNIPDVPVDLAAMETEAAAFERDHVGYDPANRRLLDATVAEIVRRTLPLSSAARGWAERAVLWGLPPLLGERSTEAFGLPPATQASLRLVEGALRARSAARRLAPARSEVARLPHLPTYPDGVQWADVGPPHARRNRT